MLRRTVGALFVLAAVASPMAEQKAEPAIIENSTRPAAGNAGRLVDLKETLRISDEGRDFYFKWPFRLKVGPEGSIFVQEQEQLLKFDASGKFLRNYFRKGQGPGEVSFISGFLPAEAGVIVQSSAPGRLIWYAEDGSLIRETALQSPVRLFEIISKASRGFVFTARDNALAALEGTVPGVVVVGHRFFILPEGRNELEELGSFPVEVFVIKSSSGGGGMIPVSRLIAAPAGAGRIVLTHTQEYLVKVLDLESKTVVRSFRRPYERIKFQPPQKGGVVIDGKAYTHGPRRYSSDIESLFVVGERVWAVTSTRDKGGHPLIDVFDLEGRYLDRFYLRRPSSAASDFLSERNCVIRGGFLYQLEQDADGIPSVAKYEIVDFP